MHSIKESCIEFFQNEDIRKVIIEVVKPIRESVYNELYMYIWLICIYNVFLIVIIVANLFLLLKLLKKTNYLTLSG
jgi:type IV secretory pathway component VirB8